MASCCDFIQVNGKVRSRVMVPRDIGEKDAVVAALEDQAVAKLVTGAPKKVIFVRNRSSRSSGRFLCSIGEPARVLERSPAAAAACCVGRLSTLDPEGARG